MGLPENMLPLNSLVYQCLSFPLVTSCNIAIFWGFPLDVQLASQYPPCMAKAAKQPLPSSVSRTYLSNTSQCYTLLICGALSCWTYWCLAALQCFQGRRFHGLTFTEILRCSALHGPAQVQGKRRCSARGWPRNLRLATLHQQCSNEAMWCQCFFWPST